MKGKDLLIIGTYLAITGAITVPLYIADEKISGNAVYDLYDNPKYINEDGSLNRKGKTALVGLYALNLGKGMAFGSFGGSIGLKATRKIFKL